MNQDEEDAAARAFAAIEKSLQGFSSPMVGDLSRTLNANKPQYASQSSTTNNQYTMDAMEWMKDQLQGDTSEQETSMLPVQTPKRTPMMERAGTPIMSNSSSSRGQQGTKSKSKSSKPKTPTSASAGRSKYSLEGDFGGDDSDNDSDMDTNEDERIPMPVQTPLQRKFKTVSTTPNPSQNEGASSAAASSSSSSSKAVGLKMSYFGKHHDALLEYLNAKRSLSSRMELERAERELEADNNSTPLFTNTHSAGNTTNSRQSSQSPSHMFQNLMEISPDKSTAIANFTLQTTNTTSISESLAKQESKTEVDFCKSLCGIGYSVASVSMRSTNINSHGSRSTDHERPMEEGHFWALLATLRKLSLSALIWDDDSTSRTQNASSQAFFLQQLTTQRNATPKELIQGMTRSKTGSDTAASPSSLPLVLERRQELLAWIESCLELESTDTKAKLPTHRRKVLNPSHPDDPAIPSLVSEMDSNVLQILAQVCLALVLEGKKDEAMDVARSRGQAYKAAAWVGGDPYGFESTLRDDTQTVETKEVGNPHRFLWKRMTWKAGRKLLLQHSSQPQQQPPPQNSLYASQNYYASQPPQTSKAIASNLGTGLEEAAIYSILADDVQNALDNPCIRSSWTRSLCVLLRGVWGRLQDEVLHKHNSYQRRASSSSSSAGACFPGYQYEQQENEQLMNTAQLANMTEAQMASTLSNSHFLKKQQQQPQESADRPRSFSYKEAILAFLCGKSHILELCQRETQRILKDLETAKEESNDAYVHQDWEGVRFFTHLTLFLDSLGDSSTPVVCGDITHQKNAILYQYVQYLESRPDLWHMITLYVSLLPDSSILDYYPTVLAQVLDDAERQTMKGQIRVLLPHLELPILKRVVRRILSSDVDLGEDKDNLDLLKCQSLEWLVKKDDPNLEAAHLEEGLVCANLLLREFFLSEDDKTSLAGTFLSEYLPEDFVLLVKDAFQASLGQTNTTNDSDDSEDPSYRQARVNNAIAEHTAYEGYLEAYSSFETWKETLRSTPSFSSSSSSLPNYSNLNETEQAIADSNRLRSWLREKKGHLETTLASAEQARLAWWGVLTHPGGWLSVEDDDDEAPGAGTPSSANTPPLDPEEQQRRVDIRSIRSRHLVLAANLYHQVCEETAAWLSKSLHEAAQEMVGGGSGGNSTTNPHTGKEVLHKLTSSCQNRAAPNYWYGHALDMATLVASDTHGIYKAFRPADLQEFLSKLGETAVSKLMNE